MTGWTFVVADYSQIELRVLAHMSKDPVLVDAFLSDPHRPAYLVYSIGQEVLGLLEESIALVPAHRRWEVTFSTYFTGLPQDADERWVRIAGGQPARHVQQVVQDLDQRGQPVTGLSFPVGA